MASEVEPRPERRPLDSGTTAALALAFISFVVPVLPALASLVVASMTKWRLRRAGGDSMNEGLATLAQITSLFTLALVGAFIWWAESRFG